MSFLVVVHLSFFRILKVLCNFGTYGMYTYGMYTYGMYTYQACNKGGGRGGQAPPLFGRSEGAAGQRRRAALLPAPPDF